MSVNLKNDSENESCETNHESATPFATPEPKANSHTTINSRCDLHYPNFQDSPRIFNQQSNNSQIFRILTVLAYIVSVSMAAIILSIYYTFIWDPYEHFNATSVTSQNKQNINSVPVSPLPLTEVDSVGQSASSLNYVPTPTTPATTLHTANNTTSASLVQVTSSLHQNGPLSSTSPSTAMLSSPPQQQPFISGQSKFATPIAALMLSNSITESSQTVTNTYLAGR